MAAGDKMENEDLGGKGEGERKQGENCIKTGEKAIASLWI